MTQYQPKEILKEVNVQKVSLWKEFGELLLKLSAVVILMYVFLGMAVDWLVPRISLATEMKIAKIFESNFEDRAPTDEEQRVQTLLKRLIHNAPVDFSGSDFKVRIEDEKDAVNALALPGGNIVLFRGLMKEIYSENELAMVMGHELGHFANRDHLRGLGRGLVFYFLVSLVGQEQQMGQLFGGSLSAIEMKFSRSQEEKADQFGLETLERTYGHVAGATDFFERLSAKEKVPRFIYMAASHPHPDQRVVEIKKTIQSHGWPQGQRIEWIKTGLKKDE